MERKIGEIFEYNGEWYQCLIGGRCRECDFSSNNVTCDIHGALICTRNGRIDETSVIFKKLEKIGEPLKIHNRLVLRIKADAYKCMNCCFYSKSKCELTMQECEHYDCGEENKFIEIKQNKEDMEEEKHSNLENTGKNLKPFDLQKAKAGKPVCTRDGRKARIICFDQKDIAPIVGLVTGLDGKESIYAFYKDGRVSSQEERVDDLMMLPEKKTGWVNVYKDSVYDTKDKALIGRSGNGYIDTIKVEWEE